MMGLTNLYFISVSIGITILQNIITQSYLATNKSWISNFNLPLELHS